MSNALILGANATGKTNLGIALMDLKDNFRRVTSLAAASACDSDAIYLNGDNTRGYAEFSYLLDACGDEALYVYRKSAQRLVVHGRLEVEGHGVFEFEEGRLVERGGLSMVGADVLNWDFADEELSIIGYLSNVLPNAEGQIIYGLRRFVSAMGMVRVPMHSSRATVACGHLRRLVRSAEMVGEFEGFLREHGVDERLEVVAGPDGEPVLCLGHGRRVPFAQACSSGTLTLPQIFSRFRTDASGEGPGLVFIDEFDAYLHHEAAERLIRWLASMGTCQTICTTHNTSLVRNAVMRLDCVFEITRGASSDGTAPGLLIRPLADRTEREIRRVNNVEHLLRSGEFD